MSIAILSEHRSESVPAPVKPRISALRSLMRIWEQESAESDDDSADLSLMLSGMTGQHFFGPQD